jgi:hypothetical protein
MNNDPIFSRFIQRQLEEGMKLSESSDLFTLVPFSSRRFLAQFRCKGLAREEGRIVESNQWNIGIFFPEDYLRRAVDVSQVLMYLGPTEPEPWFVNIRPPFICMHIAPGAGLTDLIYGLYDLLTWNLYSTADNGLNSACAQWARHQDPKRFPVDKRPLKRRQIALRVEPLGKEASP